MCQVRVCMGHYELTEKCLLIKDKDFVFKIKCSIFCSKKKSDLAQCNETPYVFNYIFIYYLLISKLVLPTIF